MKSLKNQFYSEGLATTFYQKPKKIIDKIKNKKLKKLFNILLKAIYTILMFFVVLVYLYVKFK